MSSLMLTTGFLKTHKPNVESEFWTTEISK